MEPAITKNGIASSVTKVNALEQLLCHDDQRDVRVQYQIQDRGQTEGKMRSEFPGKASLKKGTNRKITRSIEFTFSKNIMFGVNNRFHPELQA